MKRGFYTIMAAQFFSALADNALLTAAIKKLQEMEAPDEDAYMLKVAFTISYVVLAPVVGAFADALPKGHVMLVSNTVKIIGCFAMFFGVSPLFAYAIVGLGAASYSPAKYGILTELLPAEQLVVANGWIEGLTVGAVVLGTALGGILVLPQVTPTLMAIDVPFIDLHIESPAQVAIGTISVLYLVAGAFNLRVPRTTAPLVPMPSPVRMVRDFSRCNVLLWKDQLGRISLTVTTLFWGAGALLQVLVLIWSQQALSLELGQASLMQAVVAIGVTIGAGLAAVRVTLRHSVRVVPLGVVMGVFVMAIAPVTSIPLAVIMMLIVGGFGGFFVVPLNALLQHRGHSLMGAGQSISVQAFNENLSILAMSFLFARLTERGVSVFTSMGLLGLFVASTMLVVHAVVRRSGLREVPIDGGAGH